MREPNATTALIDTLSDEYTKTRSFHDGQGRNTYIVQAPVGTPHGGPALITKFTYVGLTSVPEGSVEYVGVWDQAWDIVQDTPS